MFKFFTKKTVKPFSVPEYIVFNVDNFNIWFNNPNNNAIYANPGIFLRLDKLSLAHIVDYFEKCYGINPDVGINSIYSNEDMLHEFMNVIREDWKQKIGNK